jgi:hypothetical protein
MMTVDKAVRTRAAESLIQLGQREAGSGCMAKQ